MTTLTDIESAWDTLVWADSSVASITDKVFKYEVLEVSEKEVSRIYYEKEVNFFEFVIIREVDTREIGSSDSAYVNYQCTVRYTRAADTNGNNYRAVRDAFSTIQSVVQTALTGSWNGTIDYYENQEGPAEIELITFADTRCFRGTYQFTARKFESI